MKLGRRNFFRLASGALAATGPVASGRPARAGVKVKAIAFDAFPIFDPRPVFSLTEELYPGRGAELGSEWRTRQFEYAWLRTLEGQYADFWSVTQDALAFATRKLGIVRDEEKVSRLMNAYLDLKPWPDVGPALRLLKDLGVRLGDFVEFFGSHADVLHRGFGAGGDVRAGSQHGSGEGVQTGPASLRDGRRVLRATARGHCFRRFCRMGRGGREGVWLSYFLGEPSERHVRGTRRRPRRDRREPERIDELRLGVTPPRPPGQPPAGRRNIGLNARARRRRKP